MICKISYVDKHVLSKVMLFLNCSVNTTCKILCIDTVTTMSDL